MYNYSNYPMSNNVGVQNSGDERFIGGFAFPFLLGGVTGAALAPNFWGPGYRPYPNYGPRPYPYGPGFGPGFGPRPYPYR